MAIRIEGGLISAELLEDIISGEAQGQRPQDFGLRRTVRLADEIAVAWGDARAYWEAFQRRLQRLRGDDPATSVTRGQWILPLLGSLGYEALTYQPRAAHVDGSTFAISHRDGPDENALPVHIEGCRTDLDRRAPTGRPRLSPHGLVQEYLNRTEHLWGIVTNGYRLRLLRDNALMTRPAYVEFDLQQIMEGERFADFALFYRLVHCTRLPRTVEDAPECWLEQYYQQALEQGGRVRDRLRDGVEAALQILGTGFLRHPASRELRRQVQEGHLSATDYYRQLLRLIYRLLFLMVCEERNLVGPNDGRLEAVYRQHYSVSRLRDLAEMRLTGHDRYDDLWQGLCTTFRLYKDENLAQCMGMHALDGDLFGPHAMRDLGEASISNADLLRALRRLSLYREGRAVRRVNYAALDVEELGSVYESLLEYHPVIEERDGRLRFAFLLGSERKSTGSYYTRPELVQELVRSALEPVIADRLKGARTPGEQERAILSIKVLDPASGSGHFLLAAARRLGRELARVRTGEEHPSPGAFRAAVRDVIRHCIYGVDKNPLAVDLCKVALWLEGHNKGLPLTFLDHRIKCGDSLVGVLDLDVLVEGIPDDAYKPVSGDDKGLARALRKRNKQEREGQLTLEMVAPLSPDALAGEYRAFAELEERTAGDVRAKAELYQQIHGPGTDWWDLWAACNLWTAAFFVPMRPHPSHAPAAGGWGEGFISTTADVRRYLRHPKAADARLVGQANALAAENRFFHWPLEFPDVFALTPHPPSPKALGEGGQGGESFGFDVVLCNPPWERIKLQEREFFATRDLEIANAPNAAARKRLIRRLPQFAKRTTALRGDGDAKVATTAAVLRDLLEEGYHPIVWCRYIATSDYVASELRRRLSGWWPDIHIISITGALTEDERQLRVAELSRSPRRVLVATDCLSEGINLQEAFNAVVHYDLPWNPNRLEQREGRVDRYGQVSPRVKAVLLYGRDNPVDGAVLDVLIRKAIDIRKALGVMVPVPVESESVVEAVLRSLFLRSEATARQLSLFETGEGGIEGMHRRWDEAVDRERISRTRFAQHAIRPEEVARELEETEAVLGDPEAVERFVRTACQRLGAPLQPAQNGVWHLDTRLLPEELQSALNEEGEWRITFHSPPPRGAVYVGRNHPLTAILAEHLLGQALAPESDRPPAARSAVIRTDAVARRTTLLLLRLRHLLKEWNAASTLAEECVVCGFRGRPGSLTWLSEEKAMCLLEEARPRANVSQHERQEWLKEALSWLDELAPELARLAHERAGRLLEAHRRVRKITREGRLDIQPHLPADVLGIYVLLPAP